MTPSQRADPPRRSPESVDRLMVVGCGVVWLVLLVVAVIASVGLVDLGSDGAGGESPWLLYTIIVVSGLTILGAIPLLLRARGQAGMPADEPRAEIPAPPAAPGVQVAPGRVFGSDVGPRHRRSPPPEPADVSPVAAAVERVLVRGTASLVGAAGLALTAIATATYLLTTGNDIPAIVALGIAGAITAAMPVIVVLFNRRIPAPTPAVD